MTVESLKDIPLIMLSPDTLGRRFLDQIFRNTNLQPNIVMELSSSEEVKRMVELNLGAAVVSKLSIASEVRRGTLKLIKVASWRRASRRRRTINRAIHQLRDEQFLSDLKGMPEDQFIGSE